MSWQDNLRGFCKHCSCYPCNCAYRASTFQAQQDAESITALKEEVAKRDALIEKQRRNLTEALADYKVLNDGSLARELNLLKGIQIIGAQCARMREALENECADKHGLDMAGSMPNKCSSCKALSTPPSEYEKRVQVLEQVAKAAEVFNLLLQPSGEDGRWIIEGHRSFGDRASFALRSACSALQAFREGSGG